MKYYVGADLGTSALKLLLVGEDGTIAYETQREYEVYFPRSSWSEQNPSDWWTAFKDGITEITNKFNP